MKGALASVLALAVLAGCLHVDEPTAPASTDAKSNRSLPIDLKLPDNRTGEFNAFKETNVTSGGHHNHDYWNGRMAVTILDEDTSFRTFVDVPEEGAWQEFRLKTPNMVYEGTERVELLFTNPQVSLGLGDPFPPVAQPAPRVPSAKLLYKHAATASTAWEDGGAVTWGTPIVIAIKKSEWTDMPHATGSLWVFRLETPDKGDFGIEFHAKIDVFRVPGEIPKWPGHPEFYTKTHYRPILDGVAQTDEFAAREIAGGVGVRTQSTPGRLVSYGTRTLIVAVNVSAVDSAVPPTHWLLEFHNASWDGSWNATDPRRDPTSSAVGGSYLWILNVDPNGMDSPYAADSRWEFRLRGAWSGPVPENPAGINPVFWGGWAPYKVDYAMSVIATDLVAPEYTPWIGMG